MTMQNFHENKLWQNAFVVLMDIHNAVDTIEGDSEVLESLLQAAQNVAAKIADGLSRNDRRIARELIFDAIGLVAVIRTQLAVCWGLKLLDSNTFKSLDDKYQILSSDLQTYR